MEKESKDAFTAVLSTRAVKEIGAAWEWYEERSAGLGDRFVTDVKAKIRQMEKGPHHFGARHKEYREAVLDSFPYHIVYRISARKQLLRVISVFHAARNPKKKY